ncbi:MAG: response regulator transcription factor [Saprospiraceae bacterium]|nr:response regulator transcription factor [Saprospiraceae bacterium]
MDVDPNGYFYGMFLHSFKVSQSKYFWLIAVFLLGELNAYSEKNNQENDKINLALRRTADQLLRLSGDSMSRIPAIQQKATSNWRIQLNHTFSYEALPELLQSSLDLYGISSSYTVSIKRCADDSIDLGFHKLDLTINSEIPCAGRTPPDGCHYIDLEFLPSAQSTSVWRLKETVLLFALMGFIGVLIYKIKRAIPKKTEVQNQNWIYFGDSKLDLINQKLSCNQITVSLTFREAKLLHLFIVHKNKLLDREFILQEVWADEGVLVGRSIDVFVSRLRKKLASDPGVNIVGVHGIGYRLETAE